MTILRTERGDVRVLDRKMGTMTFHRALNYRELAPGQEYSVTIPLCLDEVDLAGWKQCSCELETRYYNQQGKIVSWGLSVGLPESCCNEKNISDVRTSGHPVPPCPRMGGQGRQRN